MAEDIIIQDIDVTNIAVIQDERNPQLFYYRLDPKTEDLLKRIDKRLDQLIAMVSQDDGK